MDLRTCGTVPHGSGGALQLDAQPFHGVSHTATASQTVTRGPTQRRVLVHSDGDETLQIPECTNLGVCRQHGRSSCWMVGSCESGVFYLRWGPWTVTAWVVSANGCAVHAPMWYSVVRCVVQVQFQRDALTRVSKIDTHLPFQGPRAHKLLRHALVCIRRGGRGYVCRPGWRWAERSSIWLWLVAPSLAENKNQVGPGGQPS